MAYPNAALAGCTTAILGFVGYSHARLSESGRPSLPVIIRGVPGEAQGLAAHQDQAAQCRETCCSKHAGAQLAQHTCTRRGSRPDAFRCCVCTEM